MRYLLLAVALSSCASMKQWQKETDARNRLDHEVYINVEDSLINSGSNCNLGAKINSAIERYKDALK